MNSCPSRDELRSLLDDKITDAEERRLLAHLETCPACRETWEAIADGFAAPWGADGQACATPVPEFLKRFQENLPEEVLALERQDPNGHTSIQFPGPPTLLGKLGQLEHFHIKQELGRGATGVVFLAWDEKLDRAVAIKVLKPESLAIELVRTRFEREARAASSVSHEHIVRVYEIRSIPGFPPYMVMDYVEGESVAQLIARKKSVEPREAARIVLQVAQGLSAAHRQGLVHRDIKSSNLLLKKEEATHDQVASAVITDFGLARTTAVQDEGPHGRLTRSGEIIGTPEYMSPEQIATPESIDGRSDLFSLGVVLFELLTGRPPFQAASTQDTLRLIRFEEPHAPRRLNARIPRDLETICLKCLDKEPRRRFPTASALADELGRYLAGRPILSRPVGTVERVWRWSRRNPKLAGVGSLAVAALLAAVAVSIAFAHYQFRAWQEERLRTTKLTLEKGLRLCEEGEGGQGMLWLARSLQMAPADAVDLHRLIRANLAGWALQLSPLKAIFENQSRVLAVAFSPDGHTILTGTADGTAQPWDTFTGEAKGKPFLHGAQVLAVAFSPDGKAILTGCADKSARLWEIATGKLLRELPHKEPVFAVSFDPDGKTLFSGSGDGTVQRWEASSGKPVGESFPHEEMVLSLAISSDGRTLVTGSEDGKAQLWNVATREPIGKPFQHPGRGAIWAVAFSPDDKTLVTGSTNEALHWELAKGESRRGEPLQHQSPVRSVAFSRDGRTILTGSDDKTARLWDAASGRPLGVPLQHAGRVRSVAFSPDCRHILTGSEDRSARLWQAPSVNRRGYRLPHQGRVWAVAFSRDGKTALTGSADKTAWLWDVATGMPVGRSLQHGGAVRAIAFSPDSKTVLTGSEDKTAQVWDARTGEPLLRTPLPHGHLVRSVAYSPDGKMIATGCFDYRARVWDAITGQLLAVFPHDGNVFSVVFNSDGTRILTGSNDCYARLWHAATGEPVTFFRGHRLGVLAAAISLDDKTILTGSDDETAQVWDAVTGNPHGPPLRHHGAVYAVALSPDGLTALTGSDDNKAQLWKVAAGTPLGAALVHRDAVRSVAFSPDGRLLLTGSHDHTARVWDVATAKPFGPSLQHTSRVWKVAFSPDGTRILTGSDDSAWLWELPAPLEGPPNEVMIWTKVLTGMELDEAEVAQPLSPGEWQQRRRLLDEVAEPPTP
jgi:WD40 repeat protein/serine/threonine protein kinase